MADQEKILATFNRLRTHASPFWVLSFLEGTRATTKKLEQSREFERKNQLPELTYVLSPRTKGFLATLAGLGSLTQAVYDFTIAYEGMKPGKVPGLLALFFGPIERIHVHVKRFPIGEIPLDEHARAQWVQQRFVEKDKLLARFHETGVLR